MLDKILERLEKYLKDDYDEDIATVCSEQAIAEFRNRTDRNKASDDDILSEYGNAAICCMFDVALFRFTKYGAEFQSSDIENGRTRHYINEETIYISYGIFPRVKVPYAR